MTPFKTNYSVPLSATKQSPFGLRVHKSDGTSSEVHVHGAKYAIGSGPRCQLRLREPGIEPLHVLFVCDADNAIVRRWSTHTLLNGKDFNDAPLEIGDRLSLGQLEIEVIPSSVPAIAHADIAIRKIPDEVKEECSEFEATDSENTVSEDSVSESNVTEDNATENLVALEAAEYVFEQLKSANQTSRGRARKLVAALRSQRQVSSALEQRIQSLECQLGSIDSLPQTPLVENSCEVAGEGLVSDSSANANENQLSDANIGHESIELPCSTVTADVVNGDGQPVHEGTDVEGPDAHWNGVDESPEENSNSSTDSGFVDGIASRLADIQDIERELGILQDSDSTVPVEDDNSSALEVDSNETTSEDIALDDPVDNGSVDSDAGKANVEDNVENNVEGNASPVELSGSANSLWGLGSDDGIDDELLGPNVSGRRKSIVSSPVEKGTAEKVADEPATPEPEEPEQESVPEIAQVLPGAAPPEESGLSDSSLAHLRELAIWKDESPTPTELPEAPADEPAVDEQSIEEVSELPVELNSSEAESAPEETPIPEVAAAVEPASVESETGASSDSFIERYAHMFDDDDAGDIASSESAESAVQPPAPASPMNEPAADTSADDDSEDSLDEYMVQLMQRVRGETPASDAAAPVSTAQATVQPAVLEPELVAVVEEPVPQTPISLEEIKKTEPRPEQATDMKALRELANHSARKAIGVHANRKRRDNATGGVIIAVIAMASSVYLLLTSPAMLSPQFFGGCLALLIAVGWGVKILGALLRAERVENAFVAGKSAVATKPALPIDGTVEPASQSGSSINFK